MNLLKSTDTDLAGRVEAAIATFEAHPERRTLREREAELRGELTVLEREIAGLLPSPSADPAIALAEGREPAATEVRQQLDHQRAALSERRAVLLRAIEVLARRRGEMDGRVAGVVLAHLLPAYRAVVAEQVRRVRQVAEANDELLQVSDALERGGLIGASSLLFPMCFVPAGGWADPWSRARLFWREAVEHGFIREAE